MSGMNWIPAGENGTLKCGNGVARVTLTCADGTRIGVTLPPNLSISIEAGSGDVSCTIATDPAHGAELRLVRPDEDAGMPARPLQPARSTR